MTHRSEVHVRVTENGARVEVVMEDNGCGFDPQQLPGGRKRHGLDNVRKRMQGLGGEVCLDTAPGQGTRIKFHLDLDTAAN